MSKAIELIQIDIDTNFHRIEANYTNLLDDFFNWGLRQDTNFIELSELH